MQPLRLQIDVTLSDDNVQALAEILAQALRRAEGVNAPADEQRQRRLLASQHALFSGKQPPTDEGLLIDSRQAAKLLKVSARTLWQMQHDGQIPAPIRIGRAVRWSLRTLTKWVEDGCPPTSR